MIIMLHVELVETFPEYSLIHLQLWTKRQFFTHTQEQPDSSINSMLKGNNLLLALKRMLYFAFFLLSSVQDAEHDELQRIDTHIHCFKLTLHTYLSLLSQQYS